ncbi:MAG: bifunctional tRNA (5-methylaminomethyl-2-thiouridine)(34)-methyltransferase MnmD/FAD-dependent 5-carboxymethylaminomethyl-2-thiouridine(34) oxidoreductase MnmC [Bacterioplanes sp.]|nr:bifunctional tRNA (5-methylaminomethyl-2-thiouridine)(34)-methyltransferase MnmD/FAD-dependent 5-carboxymethylaminomethyl-2-thiouridine(34) oxidoreductase MnmC [Bacterioplanes sp.]
MTNPLHAESPDLDWLESGLPVSKTFSDPYFSLKNGLEESEYVFVQHNHLPERWKNTDRTHFSILETGFGTGLNFLCTWRQFQQHTNSTQWLHFTSIEKYPLTQDALRLSLSLWPELADLTERLLQQYPDTLQGFHHIQWPEQRVQLTLIFADINTALTQLSSAYDAFFLDGFAPAKNPDMWTDSVFQQLKRLAQLSTYSTFSTFTAARSVQRQLTGAGFQVEKVPGYGLKREMLRGHYHALQGPEQPAVFHNKPWLCLPPTSPQRQAIIIGAGLAGATTARALAERGFLVTVLDKLGIAEGASGNPQGGLYINIAADPSTMHTQFYLAAQRFAIQHIQQYLGPGDESNPHWQQCGVLQLAHNEKEAQRQQRLLTLQYPTSLFRAVNATEASSIAGLTLRSGGLFFPNAGWVSPVDYCKVLLAHPNIQIQQDKVTALSAQTDGHWQVNGTQRTYTTPHVVLANAADAGTLVPQLTLPIKTIRGQLSLLDSSQWHSPNTVLCARGYMPPARNGIQCLGATYNLGCDEQQEREQDHHTNLLHAHDFGELHVKKDNGISSVVAGRVGFRCTTADYLPIVGPAHDRDTLINRFACLQRNANAVPATAMPWQTGLWLNIGHGSKGLSSAALSAEIIASAMNQESQPVSNDMREALMPARFVLRDLRRGKTKTTESLG